MPNLCFLVFGWAFYRVASPLWLQLMDWLLQSYLCHSAFHHNGYQGLSLVGREGGHKGLITLYSQTLITPAYRIYGCKWWKWLRNNNPHNINTKKIIKKYKDRK